MKNDKNLLIKNAVTSKRFLMEKENGKLFSKTEMFKELNFSSAERARRPQAASRAEQRN